MSEFTYHIHYRPGFKKRKLDGLSKHSEKEKSEIDANFFDEVQLRDLENIATGEEEDAEDVELEGIDIVILEQKNEL